MSAELSATKAWLPMDMVLIWSSLIGEARGAGAGGARAQQSGVLADGPAALLFDF